MRHMIAAYMMGLVHLIRGSQPRDERGNGGVTLEQVVWIVSGLVAAILVTAVVYAAIKGRLSGIS